MRYLIIGGALFVLSGCGAEKASAPIHRHIAPSASIICPTGFTGMVIRTGNSSEEVCVPAGEF